MATANKTTEQHPLHRFNTGILNHNEAAARDTTPERKTPNQPVTTLATAALGPKMPPGAGD